MLEKTAPDRRPWTLAALATVIVTAAVLAILVGCGAVGEDVAWIEWTTSYFENYYPRWMDDFEKAHADRNVRIRFRAMPSNAQQKVYTMLLSHTLSDVVYYGNETAPLLLDNKALEPVPDGYLNREDFMPISLSMLTDADGALVAIPHDSGIRPFIYFDTNDLEQAGTSTAEVPTDFDGYRAWAAKLFRWDVDGSTVVGAVSDGEVSRASMRRRPLGITRAHVPSAYPFVLSYIDPLPGPGGVIDNSLDEYLGGPPSSDTFRFDSPEFVRGLEEWQKFFAPKASAIADGDTERLTGLQSDVYAGCEAGNWIFGEVFTVDMQVSALPHAPGKPLKLAMTIAANGVSRESKHKDLALEFARYVSGADREVDAYYGHGYLPVRFSAWKRLDDDDREDGRIREQFLSPYRTGQGGFLGEPQIKRRSHDEMDILVFLPLSADWNVVTARSWEAQPEVPAPPKVEGADDGGEAAPKEDILALASRYAPEAKALSDKVAAATGYRVTVKVQGTPEEMVAIRSRVPKSPVPVYLPLLDTGVYQPYMTLWNRINAEVLARAIQFVSKDPDTMSPEEAAKWCQDEATAILAGKK